MSFTNFGVSAFWGGGIRSAVFAYFGNALLEPGFEALVSATTVFLFAPLPTTPANTPKGAE